MERETSAAGMRVEDAETAVKQAQDHMRNAEHVGFTPTKLETAFVEMLNAIRDSLSDLASSDDRKDGDNKNDGEDDPAVGMLSEDDASGWVMCTISKWPMPQVISQPGSSQMEQGSRKPQTHEGNPSLPRTQMPDWSPIQ